MKSKEYVLLKGIIFLCIVTGFYMVPSMAVGEKNYTVPGKNYVLAEDSNFDYTRAPSVDTFFYGSKSMGALCIYGTVEKDSQYNGYHAYGVSGELTLHYDYNGRFIDTPPELWHVEPDGTRRVRNYDLGFLNNIASGCIMIEYSFDGQRWEKAIDPIKNYFNKEKTEAESLIYRIPELEYTFGIYYRVVVAYKFARRTRAAFLNDEYDRRKCVEVYEFYVASENNNVIIRDMGNGSVLEDRSSTYTGFMITKNNDTAIVRETGHECSDYECFMEPGEYTIVTRTKLGTEYSQRITVTNGMDFTLLNPETYESEKDKGFPLSKRVSVPVFGSNLTSMSLAIPKGFEIKQDGAQYGITGNSISLYLKLNKTFLDLSFDTWGKNKKQQVCGVETGEVGYGALIIQTSRDGRNWVNVDKGRYAKGLYTTNYALNYGKGENVLIYTPSGKDVINGVHIRILFAYQVHHSSQKKYLDYVEVYKFYLCSNELGAVTFHNLSEADTLEDTFGDLDQNTVEVYKQAESLEDGGYTTTGFEIDKELNPTVKHTVICNGTKTSQNNYAFAKSGKYDITLTSVVGSTRNLTIYVDRLSPEEAMERYFGDGFLSGKRIFSEGEYPVYEGGKFSYFVAGVNSDVLPLYGQIRNMNTGSVITIEQNRQEKTGVIEEPGIYQAVFSTSEKTFTGELAGDARVFTFRFQVIQQGTAPGPVVNKKLLEDYSCSTVSDCYPIYYGLTYSSAGKGYITLAFATKEAAVAYAYNYEKGAVEQQEDGSYRYIGTFVVGQKTKFETNWDLTDAVNYFAEAAVQKHFFDMSDEFTYLSMAPEVLKKHSNLRQLVLDKSITIFADGQKEKLASAEVLPLLNDKPYAFYNPETGETDRGVYSFKFVTDQFGGIDSAKVTIKDSENGLHIIHYGDSVGQQLLDERCPSGIVTVREETVYGDSTEYPAVYIAPGDNKTELTITYTQNKERKRIVFNQESGNGSVITADSFAISELYDPIDPYAVAIIKHNGYEAAYTAKDISDLVWSEPGKYSISCVNRMGYGFNISVTVSGREDSNDKGVTTVNPLDPDYAMHQSWQQLSTVNDRAIAQKKTEEQKTKGNTILIIIGGIVGIGIIVGLILFLHSRIRLFSRMSDVVSREEDDKHV